LTEYQFQQRQFALGGNAHYQEQAWHDAAPHRSLVSRILIGETTDRRERLAILGPGPCNDILLKALKEWYLQVHLFDLDGQLVWNGIDFQGFANADWIHVHGNSDVTGVRHLLKQLRQDPPSDAWLDEIIESAANFRLHRYSQSFDVVSSTCLLSQIMEFGIQALGESHPRLVDLLVALRRGHILMLRDLCKPTGIVNLITDFVSSETLPGLEGFKGNDLNNLLTQAIEQRNFFHGMNPLKIMELLTNDPTVAPRVTRVRGSNTWVWNATDRHYAVTAFQFEPRGDDPARTG